MQSSEPNYALLYDSQVLRAKIAIRDHYLKNVVKEIYENSGQLLSLVRIQLENLKRQTADELQTRISSSGELVGEVIQNLREMSRNFSPEKDITSEAGIVSALERELNNYSGQNRPARITVTGMPFAIAPDAGLIYFHLILDISFVLTSLYGEESLAMDITYTHLQLSILIKYDLKPTGIVEEEEELRKLELEERINLIGGKLFIYKKQESIGQIEISLPYSA